MPAVTILNNTASAADIQAHLLACDTHFLAVLMCRTDIAQYAQKMADLAYCFEIWQDQKLVGLLALYCNQPAQAFITNVSVLPDLQGQGYAAQLMTACIAHVQLLRLASIVLKVDKFNQKAIHFYQKMHFEITHAVETEYTMQLSLARLAT